MTRSGSDAARALLEGWSAKDADAVTALMTENVTLTAQMVPGGRIQGIAAIHEYLSAQNGDYTSFPADSHAYHRAMAAARTTKIQRLIEHGNEVALEATLPAADGRPEQNVAVFIDTEAAGINAVAVYFRGMPSS